MKIKDIKAVGLDRLAYVVCDTSSEREVTLNGETFKLGNSRAIKLAPLLNQCIIIASILATPYEMYLLRKISSRITTSTPVDWESWEIDSIKCDELFSYWTGVMQDMSRFGKSLDSGFCSADLFSICPNNYFKIPINVVFDGNCLGYLIGGQFELWFKTRFLDKGLTNEDDVNKILNEEISERIISAINDIKLRDDLIDIRVDSFMYSYFYEPCKRLLNKRNGSKLQVIRVVDNNYMCARDFISYNTNLSADISKIPFDVFLKWDSQVHPDTPFKYKSYDIYLYLRTTIYTFFLISTFVSPDILQVIGREKICNLKTGVDFRDTALSKIVDDITEFEGQDIRSNVKDKHDIMTKYIEAITKDDVDSFNLSNKFDCIAVLHNVNDTDSLTSKLKNALHDIPADLRTTELTELFTGNTPNSLLFTGFIILKQLAK